MLSYRHISIINIYKVHTLLGSRQKLCSISREKRGFAYISKYAYISTHKKGSVQRTLADICSHAEERGRKMVSAHIWHAKTRETTRNHVTLCQMARNNAIAREFDDVAWRYILRLVFFGFGAGCLVFVGTGILLGGGWRLGFLRQQSLRPLAIEGGGL